MFILLFWGREGQGQSRCLHADLPAFGILLPVIANTIEQTRPLTKLLRKMRFGDSVAANAAYSEAYQELRQIAMRLVRREHSSYIAATELVNETYLRHLRRGTIRVENRQHFYSIAARSMRHVLIDLARERMSSKRNAGGLVLPMEKATYVATLASTPEEMISLDNHLRTLEKLDPQAAEIFGFRYFLGYTSVETEELLSIDPTKSRNDWEYAKAWLRDRVNQDLIHEAKRSAK